MYGRNEERGGRRGPGVVRLLYPGVRVKRYLLVVAAGFFLLGLSLAVPLFHLVDRARAHAGLAVGPLVGFAILLVVIGSLALWRSITEGIGSNRWTGLFYSRHLARGPKIVALGGGTGLPAVLRGLKEYTANLTAVVTVADNGGSSGRLRGDLGMLPPGDIRNCMVALADTEPLMERLFQHRFEGGELSGHAFGNLFLAAMEHAAGDFVSGLRAASRVLAVRGQVLPATLDQVELVAELEDGRVIRGESQIGESPARIRRIRMEPEGAHPLDETLTAIAEADLIVLGPGSLYTSVIPNLLVRPLAEAVTRSRAVTVYVANVMTQPGETSHFRVQDHIDAIHEAVGQPFLDVVLVNSEPVPPDLLARYEAEGAEPVTLDEFDPGRGHPLLVTDRLLLVDGVVRHDPEKLGRALLRILTRFRPRWAEGHFFDALWLESRLRERRA